MTNKVSKAQELTDLLSALDRTRKMNKLMGIWKNRKPAQRAFMVSKKPITVFMAANRGGKTQSASATVAIHLTGKYPDDWTGRRWDRPIDVWVGGVTNETTRDIIQAALLGDLNSGFGTGAIPADCLDRNLLSKRTGLPNAVDTIQIKHVSGGFSTLQFKSAEQGRAKWQGTSKDLIWMDEEFPRDVFDEARTRLVDKQGLTLVSYSPIDGYTITTKWLMEEAERHPNIVQIFTLTWDDADWLDEGAKEALISGLLPHEIEARKYGRPAVGTGLIYPFAPSDYVIEPFTPEKHWKALIGLDPGYASMAIALLLYVDDVTGDLYVVDEKVFKRTNSTQIADSVRKWGECIPMVVDPAGGGSSQVDGQQVLDVLQTVLGPAWPVEKANNAVNAGIEKVTSYLDNRSLFITSNCETLIKQMQSYVWDKKEAEKGMSKPLKRDDHGPDCLRYTVMGLEHAQIPSMAAARGRAYARQRQNVWKPLDPIIGY